MAENMSLAIDPRSGFCRSNSTFYSKRKPIPLPKNHSLDVTTFISARAHHGKVAFIDAATGRHLTFSELWRAVDSVATCLSDMGIRKGHVVLLLSPNSIFFPIVCLSVMSLGAIITTTNPLNTANEIGKQVADSKPVLAFTIPQLLPKLAGSTIPIVLLEDHVSSQAGEAKIVTTLHQMMKREPSGSRVRDRVNQDDTATLLYSSGTTGASKGVVSSHRNLIAMVQTVINRFSIEVGEKFICTVPMFHIYGLVAFATGLLASGSTVIVLSKFEMHDMLSTIENMEAKVVDPDSGKALNVNQTGELRLRGPSVMKGYFSNPEATTSTLDSDGWLRTGDLCYIDEDGFVFIVDRLKELIKYKGYQVPPAELEALLLSHPEILDAAVIPFPDREVGQFPMAYVVRKPGSNLSETGVMDFVGRQVAPYKRIRKVAFVASIPKNPSGKILRKDLIKLATSKL
ncbi:hypothetical protein Gotri_026954 [Gossypium trilobum]|uniref:Uncharacterized protein n=1 Tax=Gossypium trilobum TaxID=34281 RepID=A0A7J9FRW5_9ROSI|nr:hypothetical protein [Gossypium trilobum]